MKIVPPCLTRPVFLCCLLALFSALGGALSAKPVSHTVFVEEAKNERSALRSGMREAMQRSIYAITRKGDWELPDFLRNQLLDEYERYVLGRQIKDLQVAEGGKVTMELKVDLDQSKLTAALRGMVGESIDDLAAAAGDPGVVIAIAPRLREGIDSGEAALIRTQVAERFKAMLGEKFLEAGFRSLQSPTWVEQEISQLRRGTSGTEVNAEGTLARDSARDFVQNIRYRSQSDLWVDFAVAGVADLRFERNSNSGLHEVSLDFTGSIFHTHAPKVGLAEPLTTSTKASSKDLPDAIQAAVIRVTDKLFDDKVFDRMLAAWESQQRRGRDYAVGLFYDDDDFRREVRDLLRSVGKISGAEDIDSYRQVIYFQPEKLDRSQMRDADTFLEVARENGDFDIDDFFVRGRPGELFIAQRGSRHEKTIEAGLTTAPDLLVDYELLKFGVKPQPKESQNPDQRKGGDRRTAQPAKPPVDYSGLPLELVMQKIALESRSALGLVVGLSEKSGTTGTAWAVAPGVWVTNAHVTGGVRQLDGEVVRLIFPNRGEGGPQAITKMVDHPEWRTKDCDVALIFTRPAQGSSEEYSTLRIADNDVLYRLDQGEPLVTLGYPSGNISARGYDIKQPEAIMQTGISVAVTDHKYVRRAPPENQLVRFNMFAAKGASGSPIMNRNGEVVAILHEGNVVVTNKTDNRGKPILSSDGQVQKNIIAVDGQNRAWRADTVAELLRQHAPEALH